MPTTKLRMISASTASRMAAAATVATATATSTIVIGTTDSKDEISNKSKHFLSTSLSNAYTTNTPIHDRFVMEFPKNLDLLKSQPIISPSPLSFLQQNITSCDDSSFHTNGTNVDKDEQIRFQKTLQYHRAKLDTYKQKWDYVENKTSRVPTTQWPAYPHALPFPHTTPISTLFPDLRYCHQSPNYQNDQSSYCHPLQFQIAYILLSQQQELASISTTPSLLEPPSTTSGNASKATTNTEFSLTQHSVQYGWKLLKQLAELGHADSMCLYAQMLNNGHTLVPMEPDPIRTVAWFHHCHSLHPNHSQTIYELGVACYTGEGIMEDEVKAVEYFTMAAKLDHAGAAYMLGDCLLDGVGVDRRDRTAALEWLIHSGELGHRGARSRVLAVLEHVEGSDYGGFTDASRQTLVDEEQQPNQTQSKEIVKEDYVKRETAKVSHVNMNAASTNTLNDEQDMEEDEESEEEEERRHWAEVRDKVLLNERRFTIVGPSSVAVLKKRRTVVLESRETNQRKP